MVILNFAVDLLDMVNVGYIPYLVVIPNVNNVKVVTILLVVLEITIATIIIATIIIAIIIMATVMAQG